MQQQREEIEREVERAARGDPADAVCVGLERSGQLANCELILIQRGNAHRRNEEISCELVSTPANITTRGVALLSVQTPSGCGFNMAV